MLATIPATTLEATPPRIVAVQGPSNADIQDLFVNLAIMWRAAGLRVAGVLEKAAPHPAGRPASHAERVLYDIASGVRYPVTQELGPGSTACRIDADGFAAACCGVETAMRRGCDLVIISKFGKLEMEGGGLKSAFHTAIDTGVPIVTSVPSYAEGVWGVFAQSLSVFTHPDREAIETWRSAVARADFRARGRRRC
jgi:hypothetical protein